MLSESLNILIVDDDRFFHETLGDLLRHLGYSADSAIDGGSALEKLKKTEFDVILLDVNMPGMDGLSLLPEIHRIRPDASVVMVSGVNDMDVVIKALRLGADDFIRKPVEELELSATLEKMANVRALKGDKKVLREAIRAINLSGGRQHDKLILGGSEAMMQVKEHIERVVEARCDTVLIEGETGTGKEVVAKTIHLKAGGEDAPFIAVNCPAIPESLIESELFGHTKGSFTGAVDDKMGYFELAVGGTLFLDEVSDLSLSAQAKLLRVLETRIVRRIGSSREKKVPVRVIAATNTSLEALILEKRFRKDLYYRLNLYGILIPPLRERKEDILPLAEKFLFDYSKTHRSAARSFSAGAMRRLTEYDYPGNVRELKNLVERAAILSRNGEIEDVHIQINDLMASPLTPARPPGEGGDERALIIEALESAKWNRREAAKRLGMPYSTLRFKISRFGIK